MSRWASSAPLSAPAWRWCGPPRSPRYCGLPPRGGRRSSRPAPAGHARSPTSPGGVPVIACGPRQGVERLLDQWTPVVAELVVSRLDLTGIVTRHVDIDEVVKAVDLDAVVARIDLDAIVQRDRPRRRGQRRGPERSSRGGRHRRDRRQARHRGRHRADRRRGHGRRGDRRHRPAGHHQGLDGVDGVGDGPECPDDGDLRRRGHQPRASSAISSGAAARPPRRAPTDAP